MNSHFILVYSLTALFQQQQLAATCDGAGSGMQLSVDLLQPLHAPVGRSIMALAIATIDAEFEGVPSRAASISIGIIESRPSAETAPDVFRAALRWAIERLWSQVRDCPCEFLLRWPQCVPHLLFQRK
jgi:hypothetical protein